MRPTPILLCALFILACPAFSVAGKTDPDTAEGEEVLCSRSTKTSTTFEGRFIDGLPIIGHNYQDVLVLAPGVTDTDGDGNPNVHGARETGLRYLLDGGDVTDPVPGTFGHNLNPLIIDEIEVITAGAPAEYGRADGGFARITSRSGGNAFEGRLAVYWRGKFLDGEGANNNDFNTFDDVDPEWRDVRVALGLGGPIVKDRLWYFLATEILDTEQPFDQIGSDVLVTSSGNYSFGKLSLQADAANALTFQVVGESRDFNGLGRPIGTAPGSDFELDQGGFTAQIGWRSHIGPDLLLESRVTRFDTGIDVRPVSGDFRRVETLLVRGPDPREPVQAVYPCEAVNCDPLFGEKEIYEFDFFTGKTTGPYFRDSDDSRIRNSLKVDLSYSLRDAWGEHGLKLGVEVADERFSENLLLNPILTDLTRPLPLGGQGAVQGFQVLTIANPQRTILEATSFSTGYYLSDIWQPIANLTLDLGVRLDREEIRSAGFSFFDPREERKESIRLWADLCREAIRQLGAVSFSSNCSTFMSDPSGLTYDGQLPMGIPSNQVRSFLDADMDGVNDVPAHVASLDLNADGFINTDTRPDSAALFRELTTEATRGPDRFEIEDAVLSPRVGVSWDPWSDGKTRLFAHWGRYHDRFILETIASEAAPTLLSFTFVPDSFTDRIVPGALSLPGGAPSINQVDRDLEIPRTDELSIGFEREFLPEWSAGLTYIRRQGFDLLQDIDLNHHTCPQASEAIGIRPLALCPTPEGTLDTDRFGALVFSSNPPGGGFETMQVPNGVPDLYAVNDAFNQILGVGNFNSYDYRAWELTLTRRLHRNWQMLASYTRSQVTGQAESNLSELGNDPELFVEEDGLLDYDGQHAFKFQAVAHLPHRIGLGGSIRWSSGIPFSVTREVVDLDSENATLQRKFFPTGQRNDQRNDGVWRIDGRIEKGFLLGRADMAAYLIVENILDSDDLIIREKVIGETTEGILGYRDFGRRFEIGAVIGF